MPTPETVIIAAEGFREYEADGYTGVMVDHPETKHHPPTTSAILPSAAAQHCSRQVDRNRPPTGACALERSRAEAPPPESRTPASVLRDRDAATPTFDDTGT